MKEKRDKTRMSTVTVEQAPYRAFARYCHANGRKISASLVIAMDEWVSKQKRLARLGRVNGICTDAALPIEHERVLDNAGSEEENIIGKDSTSPFSVSVDESAVVPEGGAGNLPT